MKIHNVAKFTTIVRETFTDKQSLIWSLETCINITNVWILIVKYIPLPSDCWVQDVNEFSFVENAIQVFTCLKRNSNCIY